MPSHILGFKRPLKLFSCSSRRSSLPPKVFGCIYNVHILMSNTIKLDPKALKCVFLGYALNKRATNVTTIQFESRLCLDVTFHEIVPFFLLLDNLIFRGRVDMKEKMSCHFLYLFLHSPLIVMTVTNLWKNVVRRRRSQ